MKMIARTVVSYPRMMMEKPAAVNPTSVSVDSSVWRVESVGVQ